MVRERGCPACAKLIRDHAHELAEMRRVTARLEARIAEQRRRITELLAERTENEAGRPRRNSRFDK